jgi:hypothetical protein
MPEISLRGPRISEARFRVTLLLGSSVNRGDPPTNQMSVAGLVGIDSFLRKGQTRMGSGPLIPGR